MFRPITEDQGRPAVRFTFDGRALSAWQGDTVAAALLGNGVEAFRETPVSGTRRGPYCLMGACFDCLVVVDRVGNRQACLTPVREGMCVETQRGARSVDALEARER